MALDSRWRGRPRAVEEIEYRYRVGGAGPEEGILIVPTGEVRLVLDGEIAKEQRQSHWLGDAELAELNTLFAGWATLGDSYPPDSEQPIYRIRCGRHWVSAGTGAGVPEQFRNCWRRLDSIAREARR